MLPEQLNNPFRHRVIGVDRHHQLQLRHAYARLAASAIQNESAEQIPPYLEPIPPGVGAVAGRRKRRELGTTGQRRVQKLPLPPAAAMIKELRQLEKVWRGNAEGGQIVQLALLLHPHFLYPQRIEEPGPQVAAYPLTGFLPDDCRQHIGDSVVIEKIRARLILKGERKKAGEIHAPALVQRPIGVRPVPRVHRKQIVDGDAPPPSVRGSPYLIRETAAIFM